MCVCVCGGGGGGGGGGLTTMYITINSVPLSGASGRTKSTVAFDINPSAAREEGCHLYYSISTCLGIMCTFLHVSCHKLIK